MRPILITTAVCAALILPRLAAAQTAPAIPPSITTPDRVESSIGTLEYKDGAPSKETVAKAYDYLDLMHGVEAFVNAYQGASVAAIFKGMEEAGVPNNTALIFSELMDAKSLFLTANADTVYFWVNLDVTQGPIVVETPPLVARRGRRHVVPVGHRLRPARSRPGRRGQVPVRAARLQGRGAGQRLLRPEDAHHPRHHARAVLPREQRPEAGGRADQEDAQGLSLPARRIRHEHRLCVAGQGDLGAHAGPQTGLGLPAAPGAGEVHRRQRQGHEHGSAQRLQLFRDAQRSWCRRSPWARSTRRSWGRWPPSAS